MKKIKSFLQKLGILSELIKFFWQEKLWWLIPFVAVLLLIGGLIVVTQSSAIAPFIYTIF